MREEKMIAEGEKETVKATEVGSFIKPVPWSEVVSVYSGAINILHPDGYLVSLVETISQMTVLGIRVASLFQRSGNGSIKGSDGIEPGMPVRFDGQRIIVKDFCFELFHARLWKGELSIEDTIGLDASKAYLFQESLLAEGKRGGLMGLVYPNAGENIYVRKGREIMESLSAETGGIPMVNGLSRFVGLGPGFTPSGDDFLSGALIGEQALAVLFKRSGPPLFYIEKEEIINNLEKTGYGGRTLLWPALQGHFPFYLLELVRGVAEASNLGKMREVVRRAVSHGETSGTDAAVGLHWYLGLNLNLKKL